ncbi:hypothetical protein HAX54_030609 [Datura stramonium]|uniref:Uncharacterized protein n=1 Tax=Datura stramonium TaxID=4076 RepID=A0ABS8SB54_DATST|nr:hypothetical protein [Datura stramonium]
MNNNSEGSRNISGQMEKMNKFMFLGGAYLVKEMEEGAQDGWLELLEDDAKTLCKLDWRVLLIADSLAGAASIVADVTLFGSYFRLQLDGIFGCGETRLDSQVTTAAVQRFLLGEHEQFWWLLWLIPALGKYVCIVKRYRPLS